MSSTWDLLQKYYAQSGAPSSPAYFQLVRSLVGEETVTFRLDAAGGLAQVRARAVAPGRVSSAYGTASVELIDRAKLISADVRKVGDLGVVTWRTASGTSGIRTDYDILARNGVPSFGSNVQDYAAGAGGFEVPGVPLGSRLSVQLTPYPGFSGGSVSGTAGDPIVIDSLFPVQTPKPTPVTVGGIGVFHSDGTVRSTSGTSTTELERIVVPANRMGLYGGVTLKMTFEITGTAGGKTFEGWWGGTRYLHFTSPAAFAGIAFAEITVFNLGATNSQRLTLDYWDSDGDVDQDIDLPAKDTTQDQELLIQARCSNGADLVSLVRSVARYDGSEVTTNL